MDRTTMADAFFFHTGEVDLVDIDVFPKVNTNPPPCFLPDFPFR
jgi:hypothetical protein